MIERVAGWYLKWRYGVNPLTWLDGYKTYLGGLGMIGLGVYQLSQGEIQAGLQSLAEGLAVIGIGHKIAKAAI